VKICIMVELCPIGLRGFLHFTFGGDIFKGLQVGGAKMVFEQFVFDIASVTCVIQLSADAWPTGRAIHGWTSFIAPTRGRRRRRLTCDKLRRWFKW